MSAVIDITQRLNLGRIGGSSVLPIMQLYHPKAFGSAPSYQPPDGPAGPPTGVRRLETHPDASGAHSDFPHPFVPAESPVADGRTRVPAGEGSGLYLGSPRDSLVPPPAAPQAERARARGVALEALSAPTMGPEELRLLWAEGDR